MSLALSDSLLTFNYCGKSSGPHQHIQIIELAKSTAKIVIVQ